MKAFGSYGGSQIDNVDLATGNLFLNIPLVSYPQLGHLPPLSFTVKLNNAPYFEAPPQDNSVGKPVKIHLRYDTAPPGGVTVIDTVAISPEPNYVPALMANLGAYIASSYEGGIVRGTVDQGGGHQGDTLFVGRCERFYSRTTA
jgi:hypothetical protein